MDKGFFASKYFAISLIAALVIVGGAAAGYYAGGREYGTSQDACDAPGVPAGNDLAPRAATQTEPNGERRTVSYTINGTGYSGGALDLCVSVGEVFVEPSNTSDIQLIFTIKSDEKDAVSSTEVMAAAHNGGGKLRVAAWESKTGVARTGFFGDRSASTRLDIKVPPTGAYGVKAAAHVGDVRVIDTMASALDLVTHVGDVRVLRVDLSGDATGETDVGDVTIALSSVQAGNLSARANVGNVEIDAPSRADVGYDAHAEANVGSVVVKMGPTDSDNKDTRTTGGSEDARTAGYESKPTHVRARAVTDVGDARIEVS